MKKTLFTFLALCLIFTSCGDDNNPDGGELYFELKFAKDVGDTNSIMHLIGFHFEGGSYTVDSGLSIKTDPFFANKNQNIPFVIDGSNYWACVPTTVLAYYRGKVIFQKDFQVGLRCDGVRTDIESFISGNVIIPG